MGAVYEAVHEFTGRSVAVKLMHPALARSRMAAERFLREARAPSSIGHPGIVEVFDGGRDEDGTLYLVLELLQGQPLSALQGKELVLTTEKDYRRMPQRPENTYFIRVKHKLIGRGMELLRERLKDL
jgi:serine/threonine protein kinase